MRCVWMNIQIVSAVSRKLKEPEKNKWVIASAAALMLYKHDGMFVQRSSILLYIEIEHSTAFS